MPIFPKLTIGQAHVEPDTQILAVILWMTFENDTIGYALADFSLN